MAQYHLYIMLSRTNTRIAQLIRCCTRSKYNHVSLSLDERFQNFVSFARYNQDVALAGGYVTEPADRILHSGEQIPVKIFRVEIGKSQHAQLQSLFMQAGNRDSGLIYNTLGAIFTILHLRLRINGAYTCLEFASTILGLECTTLQQLEKALTPYLIYDGRLRDLLPELDESNDKYFNRRGFLKGFGDTTVHMTRLLGRALHITHCKDPIADFANQLHSET